MNLDSAYWLDGLMVEHIESASLFLQALGLPSHATVISFALGSKVGSSYSGGRYLAYVDISQCHACCGSGAPSCVASPSFLMRCLFHVSGSVPRVYVRIK